MLGKLSIHIHVEQRERVEITGEGNYYRAADSLLI